MLKWNKLKYWQKGTIVGLLFGLFSLFVIVGTGFGSSDTPAIFDFVLDFIGDFIDNLPIHGEPGWISLLGICLFFIIYGSVGAIIGFIFGSIRQQK